MQIWTNRWAVVDMNSIRYNYSSIRGALPAGCRYLSIMKANAYGHGAEVLAPVISELGAEWFGVASLSEAVALRRVVPDKPILILGYTSPRFAAELAGYNITQAVLSVRYARELAAAAKNAGAAVQAHIKLDTGMSRIGFPVNAPASFDEVCAVYNDAGLKVTGIFTHFPVADELSEASISATESSYLAFVDFCDRLCAVGIAPGIRHCANSAFAMRHPDMAMDMVRAGICQFGMPPSAEVAGTRELRPVMSLYSLVTLIKDIPAGATVSYGRSFTAARDMRLATVAIGYADGYRRLLGNGRAYMLLRGCRAPVVGRVCMDQLMLDVTDIPAAREGDTVTIVGHDGNETLTFDDMAALCGSINYEMTCLLGERVTREYIN